MAARPRKSARTSKHSLQTAERDDRAYEMRKAGAALPAIAVALGFANASGAWKAVQREIARRNEMQLQSHEELRTMEADRLNDLHRHAMQILARPHPVLYKGAPVVVDGRPLDDDGMKLRTLDTVLKLEESYRRLFGIDAPRQVEVSGVDGEPIAHEVRVGALIERLAAIPAQVVEQPALGEGEGGDG